MRFVLICCFIVLLSVTNIPKTVACGGGGPFVVQNFDDSNLIVHAYVVEVDDRGYNAILQTDYYFKGQNNKYLAIDRFSPALEVVSAVRGYDTSCTYSGYGQKWVAGSEGYFALLDNGNGTYTDDAGLGVDIPHFFVKSGIVEFYSFDTNKGTQSLSLPVDEFEALLLKYGGKSKPDEPIPSAYPLKRFLTITTQSGQKYQLNPDRSVLPLDLKTYPLAISNDGSHVVFKLDDERLGFQYLSLEPKTGEHGEGGWLIAQVGKAALFSPDSNFVAVQEATKLTVYMFDNYEHNGYGQAMTMTAIAHQNALWLSDNIKMPMIWSADSTSIAYQDKQGIWVWDIFENSEPKLIVKNTGKMELLDLSNSGRYVRYKLIEQWFLLDTQTGQTFENAITTPNESNLIYIQPEYPEGTSDINRNGGRTCHVPLSQSCPIYILGSINIDFFWYKYDQIAFLSCGEEICRISTDTWQLSIGNTYNYKTQLDIQIPLVSAFDYDITYDQPVVAIKDYTLEFGFYSDYLRDESIDQSLDIDTVDLSKQLDSPITQLEWGQPIFYELSNQ